MNPQKLTIALLALALTACSSFPAATVPADPAAPAAMAPAATTAQAPRPKVEVTFQFRRPAAARSLQALSEAVDEVSVQLDAEAEIVAELEAEATSVDVPVAAEPGMHTFTVKTYDVDGPDRHELSSGTTTQEIVSGEANAVHVSLGGTVARLQINVTDDTPDIPAPSAQVSGVVSYTAYDEAGGMIVGDFSNAVTVGLSTDTDDIEMEEIVASDSAATGTYTYTNVDGATDVAVISELGAEIVATDATLAPRVEPVSVSIDTERPALLVDGDPLALDATVSYSDGTTGDADEVIFLSGATDVATVSGDELTGLMAGQVDIDVAPEAPYDGTITTNVVQARVFDVDLAGGEPSEVATDVALTADVDAPASSTGLEYAWAVDSTTVDASDYDLTAETTATAVLDSQATGTFDLTCTVTDADDYSVTQVLAATILPHLFDTTTVQMLGLADERELTPQELGTETIAVQDGYASDVVGVAFDAGTKKLTITPKKNGFATVTVVSTGKRKWTFDTSVTTTTFGIE
jgi:hypothetical protein